VLFPRPIEVRTVKRRERRVPVRKLVDAWRNSHVGAEKSLLNETTTIMISTRVLKQVDI
jgi:hypothetical protein